MLKKNEFSLPEFRIKAQEERRNLSNLVIRPPAVA
jgi:hypothetical protein